MSSPLTVFLRYNPSASHVVTCFNAIKAEIISSIPSGKFLATPSDIHSKIDQLTQKLSRISIEPLQNPPPVHHSNIIQALNLDPPLCVHAPTTSLINKVLQVQIDSLKKRISNAVEYIQTPLKLLAEEVNETHLLHNQQFQMPESTQMFVLKTLTGVFPKPAGKIATGGHSTIYDLILGTTTYAEKKAKTHSQMHWKRESYILMRFDHPNIIKIEAIRPSSLILKKMPISLLHALQNSPQNLTPQKVKQYALSIASALDYIHQQGYTYKDLKPENILLDANDTAILCDFGLTCPSHDDTGIAGSPDWMPPEMAYKKYRNLKQLSNDKYLKFTQKVDSWAFGAVLYSMITRLSFITYDYQSYRSIWDDFLRYHYNLPLPHTTFDGWPQEYDAFKNVLQACLHGDPNHRASISDIIPMLRSIPDYNPPH